MTDKTSAGSSNPLGDLLRRLREDGGRYLVSVALTREERNAQPEPTFGGKGHVRWLTEEEYAALCALAPSDETNAGPGPVREIFERHDRVSKLLWGGPVAVMLGPMDADAAHADRGRLLSLLTPEQRGGLKATERPTPPSE